MAYGTTKVDVIQSSTAGLAPQFNDGNGTQTGTLCRAWVNYNGSSIGGSFNVTSVTAIATGIFKITMTNALADANYAYVATVISNNSYDRNMAVFSVTASDNGSVTSPTSTSFCFKINSNGNTGTNYNEPFSVAVFR